MNIYRFRKFIKSENFGPALRFVDVLKKTDTFSKARFDVYIPRVATSKVIVCLGQKHTVLRGHITRWGAKHIAKVQARLFSYYRYFHQKWKVDSFGAEGVIANGVGNKFRYGDEFLNMALTDKELAVLKAEDEAVGIGLITAILKRLSLEWYRKMKIYGHDLAYGQKEIAPFASAVNGLRLYSFLAENVHFYPIEGEAAYNKVASEVERTQSEMIALEKTMDFRNAKLKRGKDLSEAEYNAAMKYNELSKQFTVALKSHFREKASFELAMQNLQSIEGELENLEFTVFTMGIGHRSNYKWLAPRYLKDPDVAFVLITPPELWWWGHIVSIFAWVVVLGSIGFLAGWYFL